MNVKGSESEKFRENKRWKKVYLNEDCSVGKECEENDANHSKTPNLQGSESCKKRNF